MLSKQLRFCKCDFILMLINQTERVKTDSYTQELFGEKKKICEKIRDK